MMLSDYGKLLLLTITMVGAIVLLVTHTVDDGVGVGIIFSVLGYVTGNGVLATTNRSPSLVIVPKDGTIPE